MAAGRRKADWAVAGELLAAIYNTVRDPKRRSEPFRGEDFNPYAPPKKRRGIEAFAHLAGVSTQRALEIARGD
jgi:hypothetical protein